MKKPYYNREERIEFQSDTFCGDLSRLHFAYKKSERDYYRMYWIFGKPLLHWWIKVELLNPLNKQVKYNWEKSDGRRTL